MTDCQKLSCVSKRMNVQTTTLLSTQADGRAVLVQQHWVLRRHLCAGQRHYGGVDRGQHASVAIQNDDASANFVEYIIHFVADPTIDELPVR